MGFLDSLKKLFGGSAPKDEAQPSVDDTTSASVDEDATEQSAEPVADTEDVESNSETTAETTDETTEDADQETPSSNNSQM